MPGHGGSDETTSGAVSISINGSGMASVALDVSGLEPFNPKEEAHNLSQRWKRWKRAFDLYVTGKGVSNDAQKRALLLHVAGMDVQEIYFTLAGDGEDVSFQATLRVLDNYFFPKSNVPFERHLFRQISQESRETVDQFVCRLHQRAATCEFGVNEDDYIRDQLIDKCYSSHLRRKFLEKEGTVTLGDLLRVARSQEAVDRQLKQFNTDQVDRVNAVRGKVDGNKNPRKLKTCFSCGREGHFSQDWRCPARDPAQRGKPSGLYRYKWLMFGVTSAPEKYQQIIRDVLRGCAGVANIADDLIVHGGDVEEHDKRLFAVLDRLSKVGLTVNGDKCHFRLSKLTLFGHELTSDGINPCEEKIAALRDARPPKDANEVRSFMRIVQYSSKFMPDVASVTKPIQELTRKGVVFHWGNEQQAAFEELKRLITQAETLAYFKDFELETDHKPLERIYSSTSRPCARIERWVLRLQGYDFKVVYRPGKTNIADALSRLNSDHVDHGEEYDYVRAIVEDCVPVALSPREIEEASYDDEELTQVKKCVKTGNWDQCILPSYAQVKDELCLYGELLLRGTRIVVPRLLRDRMVRADVSRFSSKCPLAGLWSRSTRTPIIKEGRNCRTDLLVWLTAYRSTPQTTTGTTPCYMMFGREMRSKLPELKRETVGVPGEEVQERDWSCKLKGKAYADLKRGATPKSISVGDTVLVKAEKTNKLSTNFNPDPFKVVHKTGSEVTLRNETGIELKRNTVFVKKYNGHGDVSNDNEDQVVQAGSAVRVEDPGASKLPETTVIPMPKEIPGTSEDSQEQPRHFPDNQNTGVGRPVRRSTRTVRPPDRYKVI
ncbi:Transposon Tf2-6 polyprotein [Stylophora pistillata]|uniref:Transposon Tf2-6 polyprotein n=1 Tax=Stylophora pistillata TaxID=50429 RepID=A0A2B4S248_STYPI|nr:Transposon Tf2-6 polyprotein [Stylophora pistillata]